MSKKFKLHEIILSETIKECIPFLLPIILPAIYSTVVSWNYKIPIISVISSIPLYVYGILSLPFIYWIVKKYYIHKKMDEGNNKHVGVIPRSPVDIDVWEYNDLIWTVQSNEHTLRKNQLPTISDEIRIKNILDSINLSHEPKCPKCGSTNITYYDRVIGYLTKIKDWSAGRQIEQKTRVYNKEDNIS